MDRLLECGWFLGHIISAEGITADPEKVKAIVCARAPTNVSELRGFLGLVQYVGRYVPDLATVAAPLQELTKKSVEFHWGPSQEKSFKKIQQLMSSCETSMGVYLRWRVDIRRPNGRPWELSGHANTLRCIFLVASFA